MFIGSTKSDRIAKHLKEKLIKDYYYFKYLGYSESESQAFVLRDYSISPDLYNRYNKALLKLIDKNKDLISKSLKADRSSLKPSLIKL